MISNMTLVQQADCCSPSEETQELTLEIRDGGGGSYVYFTTTGWAIDPEDIDELVPQLKKLIKQYDIDNLF